MISAKVFNIWRRAETGPICSEKDFIIKRYWSRVKELVEDYDIQYDPESLVPTDDTLIDDAFKAGMDLLLDVGVLCANTNRIIQFEESEIREHLRNMSTEATLGEGKDAVTYRHHHFEDKRFPVVLGGPIGTPLSEDMAEKIYLSYAQEPLVDIMSIGTPVDLHGVRIKIDSPFELLGEIYNIISARTALRKAGRPGMALYGSVIPGLAANIATSSSKWGWRRTDLRCVWLLPVLKVDYSSLTRAAHLLIHGYYIHSGGIAYLGSLSGGPETSTITAIAENLAVSILFQATTNETSVMNTHFSPWEGESDVMSLWSGFLATAAIVKNTNTIENFGCYTYAGPCTEMCLQEIAAEAIGGHH